MVETLAMGGILIVISQLIVSHVTTPSAGDAATLSKIYELDNSDIPHFANAPVIDL